MNLNEGTLEATWDEAHNKELNDIVMTNNGKWAFTVSDDRDIKQWDINNKRLYYSYALAHDNGILCIVATNDNKYIFTGSRDSTIKQWDIENQMLVNTLQVHGDHGEITCLSVGNYNKFLCAGTSSKKLF